MTTLSNNNYQNVLPQKPDNNTTQKEQILSNIDISKPQSMQINSSLLKDLNQNIANNPPNDKFQKNPIFS